MNKIFLMLTFGMIAVGSHTAHGAAVKAQASKENFNKQLRQTFRKYSEGDRTPQEKNRFLHRAATLIAFGADNLTPVLLAADEAETVLFLLRHGADPFRKVTDAEAHDIDESWTPSAYPSSYNNFAENVDLNPEIKKVWEQFLQELAQSDPKKSAHWTALLEDGHQKNLALWAQEEAEEEEFEEGEEGEEEEAAVEPKESFNKQLRQTFRKYSEGDRTPQEKNRFLHRAATLIAFGADNLTPVLLNTNEPEIVLFLLRQGADPFRKVTNAQAHDIVEGWISSAHPSHNKWAAHVDLNPEVKKVWEQFLQELAQSDPKKSAHWAALLEAGHKKNMALLAPYQALLEEGGEEKIDASVQEFPQEKQNQFHKHVAELTDAMSKMSDDERVQFLEKANQDIAAESLHDKEAAAELEMAAEDLEAEEAEEASGSQARDIAAESLHDKEAAAKQEMAAEDVDIELQKEEYKRLQREHALNKEAAKADIAAKQAEKKQSTQKEKHSR